MGEAEPSQPSEARTHGLDIALTAGRLILIPPLAQAVSDRDIVRTSVLLGAAIAWDIADGVIERYRNGSSDTPLRRIIDGGVDYATAITCFASLAVVEPQTLYWYAPLAAKEIVHFTRNANNYFRKNTVIVGGGWHRLVLLSQVALGGALLADAPLPVKVTTAITAYGINIAQILNYGGAQVDASEKVTTQKMSGINGIKRILGRNHAGKPRTQKKD